MAALEQLFQASYEPADRCKTVHNYMLGAILGQGRSSLVRRAVDVRDGTQVAIKTLARTAGKKGRQLEKQFQQETEILLRVRHPHIVTLIEMFVTSHNLYVVMEMVTGKTLRAVLNHRSSFPEEDARVMTRQLTSALCYLHDADIVHRDVKPENVMLRGSGATTHVTLIDLGLSSSISTGCRGPCGSPLYMAPELLRGLQHGPAIDMWSLGVLLHELLAGHVPFEPERGSRQMVRNMMAVYAQIIRGSGRDVCDGLTLSAYGADFLRSLVQFEDTKRLTSQQALAHPWIAR